MWIKKLNLKKFRNYDEVSLSFEKGVNYIQGENGSGKTSLVEAIGFLPLCKSIRTNDEKDLIKIGNENAIIEASFVNQYEEKLRIVILSSKGKTIEYNDVEIKKTSEIAGIVKVISFLPRDVDLFKESPIKRRRFVDLNISMLNREYLKKLSEYNKLLNDIKNSIKNEKIDYLYLKVLFGELVKRGVFIQKVRKKFIESINEEMKSIANYLDKSSSKFELKYKPDVDIYEEEKYLDYAFNDFKENLEKAQKNRIQIKGAHADDITFNFNGMDLGVYGSQGQNRIAVIAVKLSLFKLIKLKFKEEPIVIFDDVLSELDEYHQEKLINLLNRMEQVFITGTALNLKGNYTLYKVSNNIVRRNA